VRRSALSGKGLAMSSIRFALTVLGGGMVGSLTDWLFMGDLLYKRFNPHPEIWRFSSGQKGHRLTEMRAIAWSTPLPFLTCAVFALLCAHLELHAIGATAALALAIWLIAPLPLLIVHSLFMKIHPAIVVSYSLGWLAKLLVSALAVTLILR
jgi:hypothetical protein